MSTMTVDADDRADIAAEGGRQFDIPACAVSEAVRRIDHANRRLERAGVNSRFVYELERYEHASTSNGITRIESRVVLTLNAPALSFGGWRFQAALDVIDGQAIVSTAPGVDLSDWERPDAHHCDHCGLNRARTHSYVVRSEDTGELRQIGRSCLPLFLGVRPAGLWALQWDYDDLQMLTDRDMHGNAPVVVTSYDPRELLALTTVLSDRGRRFVSRAAAGDGCAATADILWSILSPSSYETSEARAWREEITAAAELVPAGDLDDMIATAAAMGGSDYAQNLRVLAGQDHIPARHVALWSSLVGVYFRHERDKDRQAALPELTGGYLADEGAKIADVTGTITTLTSWDSDYGYPPKTVTLLVVHTDCGHLLKWQGTVPDEVDGQRLERGQRMTIARATVKAHEQWKGTPQTRIVRAKLTRPADE
ncbi:hypothetical protein AB0331_15375 [Dietzia maris]|uniref:hypothetical protein n=1 Tax=Dietzia maris TaxID=37915 RepID=UPI003450CA31